MIKKQGLAFLLVCFVYAFSMAEVPADYYRSIDGKKNAELKTALHKLIKDHKRISYGGGGTWVVFRKSDVRPDGSVWDMYSNTKRFFKGSSGATSGMNIEHSVPKSWWGDEYPYKVDASFDLHHLVPADEGANMKKSNYILGDLRSISYDNGVSKVGTTYINGAPKNAFEPADEYKGDFARMYFYIATCYQDYIWRSDGLNTMLLNNTYPTLSGYAKDLLLKWHRKDPISQKELDRNNAVYSFQENRNPYIDYPSLAEYIWGDSLDYVYHVPGSSLILNYKEGDLISAGNAVIGASEVRSFAIKGQALQGNLQVVLSGDNSSFTLVADELDASQMNTPEGASLRIMYHPSTTGIHSAYLKISGGGLNPGISLQLKGVGTSGIIRKVSIRDLKTVYRRSDPKMELALTSGNTGVQWSIDGEPITSVGGVSYLDPSLLSVGVHVLKYKSERLSGTVRIEIKN